MDGEDIVCDICGDAGQEEDLAICNKCTDGAEHIYCMREMLDKVPEGDWWMCEDCKMSESKKSQTRVNCESSGSSELKLKSFHAGKRQTGVSTRQTGVQSEAQSLKEDRVTKMSAKSCDNIQLQKDFSYKTFENGKAKETKDTTSELKICSNTQDKAKVSHNFSDKRCANTLQVELDRKTKALETRARFPKTSTSTPTSLLSRESPSEKLEKANVKQSAYVSQEKPKLNSHTGSPLSMSGLSEIADVSFKGQLAKVCDLPMKKRKFRHIVSSSALDLNVNPQDGIGMVGAHVDASFSGDRIVLGCSDPVLDLNISQLPESAIPEVGPCLPVENVDDQPTEDVNNNDDEVKPHEENLSNNNDDKVKPQEENLNNNNDDKVNAHEENLNINNDEETNTDRPESLASPTSYEENLNQLYWQAVGILSSKFGL